MARERRSLRGKQLPHHLRRRLSEEGKRLLRHALAHEDDNHMARGADQASVNYSVMTNRDDSSNGSDLDGFQELVDMPTKPKKTMRWKDQYDADEREEELEKAIDNLMEKRDSTKIEGLRQILSVLCGSVMTDRIQASKQSLCGSILACLKKRMTESGTLALRALGVLAITLGSDEQAFYKEIYGPLHRLLKDECEPSLRVEAAYVLSIACFVCSSEDQSKWELVELLGDMLTEIGDSNANGDLPESVGIAIMESWAFLISSFRPSKIVAQLSDPNAIIYDHVFALAGFVRDGINQPIRSAACEVLALLVQFKYQTGQDDWSYEMEDPDSPLGDLDSKIARFMHETGKNIGKKNRKTQRSLLKEVMETLETGLGPHQDLQIENETLSLSTWSRFFQAHVFRRTLLTGFQVHLFGNEVLRDVFDVAENENAQVSMISTVKRRAEKKSRSMGKRLDQSRKDMAQNAFLYDY